MVNQNRQPIILLIEDSDEVVKGLQIAFEPYINNNGGIHLEVAATAGKALELLFTNHSDARPDLIILDIMLPYGPKEAFDLLDGTSDPDMSDTGIRLLRHLREKETMESDFFHHNPLFVAVITGRSHPGILEEVTSSLGEWGKLYTKPFNENQLVNDLLTILGIQSHIIPEILPVDYKPPNKVYF